MIAAARWRRRAFSSERDPARFEERGGQGGREARRARVGLFVVVLRGDAHQVLEPELEVERVALGAVDGVGQRRDFDPTS